ncbi:Protein kinase domain-containing protein [Aphelenchoides bicaudatus]|nr:Protein kinase domain-containing protein [Aphelenchoides bicaudatus]
MFRQLTRPRNILLIGAGTAFGYAYYQNDYSLSDIGIIRFARAGFTASAMAIDYKILLSRNLTEEAYNTEIKKCHQRGANRILKLCTNNGGIFIKVGQHVASLQYLLPEEYTSTLSILHSKAPESNLQEVKKVFKESTGKELDEVFTNFEEKPIGTASLAQVHKARLKSTGEEVAVKIQHPKVLARSLIDIATMEFFVIVAHKIFPDFHLMWLVNETKINLPKELDFLHEGKNAVTAKEMFRHLKFVHVPKVYFDYSSTKVLTMDDFEFFRKNGIDTHEICQKIGRLYSEMIFKYGFVHADPHPGNVLVENKDGKLKIILLDHGIIFEALIKPDKDEIQRICVKMGLGELFGLFACMVTARSYASVTKGITKSKPSKAERKEIQEFATSLIFQISQYERFCLAQFGKRYEAFGLSNHRSDAFLEMARCCNETIYQHKMKHTTSRIKRLSATIQLYWVFYSKFGFINLC